MAGTDKQTQAKEETTHGEAPQSAKHVNGPGMTNGVPDGVDQADATGAPNGDRKDSETAGGGGSDG